MKPETLSAPAPGEYDSFYGRYVELAREGSPLEMLERQVATIRAICSGLSDTAAEHRYAPGKWSIKEVLGHVTDTERIFAYRALRIARGDTTPLSSFDQNAFVAAAAFDTRPLAALLEEFESVRFATLLLLASLPPEAVLQKGTASGTSVSLRALVYIMAGHVEHHLRVLHERYGVTMGPMTVDLTDS